MKQPPHSVEAEQALLSGIMLDSEAWDQVADAVTASDLYRADHRLIFNAIAELAELGQPPDAVIVAEHLSMQGSLEEAGGTDYLAQLVADSAGAANIRAYAQIVRDRAMLRQLIGAAGEIAASAYAPEGREVAEIVDEAERRIFDVADRRQRIGAGFERVNELIEESWSRLRKLSDSPNEIIGVATGFNDLDKLTAGFQNGDLVIIAGRPSMGKTALALNIAASAAAENRVCAGILSMEMSKEQIMFRLIGSIGRINQKRLRNGRLSDDDWVRVQRSLDTLADAPLFIDDTPALKPTEVRARARRLKREHDLGLIVVDYLQLMQTGGYNENRNTEISRISQSLKSLARELNIPVVVLSQLNRSVEQRTDRRPMMSDLRESGAIEQDADVIIFIYREERYDPETRDKGLAEIIVAKQRNGPTDTVRLVYKGEFTRFENFVPEDYGDGVRSV